MKIIPLFHKLSISCCQVMEKWKIYRKREEEKFVSSNFIFAKKTSLTQSSCKNFFYPSIKACPWILFLLFPLHRFSFFFFSLLSQKVRTATFNLFKFLHSIFFFTHNFLFFDSRKIKFSTSFSNFSSFFLITFAIELKYVLKVYQLNEDCRENVRKLQRKILVRKREWKWGERERKANGKLGKSLLTTGERVLFICDIITSFSSL